MAASAENSVVERQVSDVDEKRAVMDAASFVPAKAPEWALWVMVVLTLTSGTLNTIVQKWMNKQEGPTCPPEEMEQDPPPEGCEVRYFSSPFWQTELMWMGELLCMPIWLIDTWIHKGTGKIPPTDMVVHLDSYMKPHCPVYFWILPTIVDYIASSLINYSFTIGQASTIQMFRNFNVAITALISLMYIQVALRRQHWFGCFFIIVGLMITGVYAYLNPDDETNVENAIMSVVAILCALIGTAFTGFQLVFQESLFRKYYASPFEGVGWMGAFGLIIGAGVLVVAEFTGIEDVSGSFYQMSQSWQIVTAQCLFIFFVAFFNGCGVTVAKLGSAVMLSIVFASRSVTVYFVELAIQWNTFDWLNFSGLVVVTVGALMYNGILFPPSWSRSYTDWMAEPVMCVGCCKAYNAMTCNVCALELKNPDEMDAEAAAREAEILGLEVDVENQKDISKAVSHVLSKASSVVSDKVPEKNVS